MQFTSKNALLVLNLALVLGGVVFIYIGATAEGATESNLTAVAATIVGVAVILIVVTGFAGMAYKKRCLLIMYGVFVAIAVFLFIAVAILGFRAATAATSTHKNDFLQRHGNYLGLAAVVLTIVSILILRIGYHLHRNPNAYREAHYGEVVA